MSVLQAKFVKSAPTLRDAPDLGGIAEIAMVGRSNVGKSSLINKFLNRKNLAKTSNTPGKTRLMNFYNVADRFALVDLPGYGYAKVSKTMQAEWQKHLQQYLKKRESLQLVLQLIDARHEPKDTDRSMYEWLMVNDMPTQVILTKVDKLKQKERRICVQRASDMMALPPESLIVFSAETGEGVDILRNRVQQVIG